MFVTIFIDLNLAM